MDVKLYRAILHTSEFKLDEKETMSYTKDEIQIIEDYMKAWDGVKVTVSDITPGEYCVVGWPHEEAEKAKDAIYLMEQDPVFGMYQNDRERFDADWAAGEWEPGGVIAFQPEEVEILGELRGKGNAEE